MCVPVMCIYVCWRTEATWVRAIMLSALLTIPHTFNIYTNILYNYNMNILITLYIIILSFYTFDLNGTCRTSSSERI